VGGVGVDVTVGVSGIRGVGVNVTVGVSGICGVGVNVGIGVTLGRLLNSMLTFRSAIWTQPVDTLSTVRTYTQPGKFGSYPINSRFVPAGRV